MHARWWWRRVICAPKASVLFCAGRKSRSDAAGITFCVDVLIRPSHNAPRARSLNGRAGANWYLVTNNGRARWNADKTPKCQGWNLIWILYAFAKPNVFPRQKAKHFSRCTRFLMFLLCASWYLCQAIAITHPLECALCIQIFLSPESVCLVRHENKNSQRTVKF